MKKQKDYLLYIRQYEILIASAAVIILVVILVFNMLLPNFDRANQIYAQGQTLKQKLAVLTQKDSTLSSLDSGYYKDVFLKLNQVLPADKDYVSLIGTFDLLEKQSGVTITRTDFQLGVVSTTSKNLEKAPATGAYVVPITLQVTGNLDAIKSLFDSVSNYNGRLMVFDDISVTNKLDGTLDVVFHGRAFFYPLPTTLGAIDAPLPKFTKSEEAILTKVSEINLPQENAGNLDKSRVGKKNLFQ